MAAGAKGKINRACQYGQTALAVRLLKRLAASSSSSSSSHGGDANLIFSPVSIHVGLAMMSAGASGGSLEEILAVAGAPSREALAAFAGAEVVARALADRSADGGGPVVAFACGAWCDARWRMKAAYRDAVVGTYKGDTATVDFLHNPVEARKQINAWVSSATRGLITEVMSPHQQSNATALVVANAIYFKGEWRSPFERDDTVDGDFLRLDGTFAADVPFMRSQCYQYIACHDGFKVLRLPYKSMAACQKRGSRPPPEFSMVVFLPDAGDGLWALVDSMAESPEFLTEHLLPRNSVPVGEFRLPRFKLSFHGSLIDVLMELGLRLPFDPEMASMTEMVEMLEEDHVPAQRIYVDKVIHKAVVEVNEEGSEAAAVYESDDDLGFSLYDDPEPPHVPVDFVADHPFVFFIVEETSGAVVFAGHVVDPSKE